ncbi:MAG TPA: zinc ribbon domain-containing protein [Terriglobia bacterium]|nr:zinc ribbon domain-containing protein [Terriglobia bacterium]
MSQQCRECGAILPDTARTCMQCGTPVDVARLTTGPQGSLQFVQPAIIGGLLLGLLSSIPILSLFSGAWVLAGGALTARLVSKQRPSGISYGDGAFGGVLAGFFGAVVSTIMLIPDKLLFSADWEAVRQQAEQQFAKTPDMPVPMRDLFLRAVSAEVSFTTVTVWLFSYGFSFSLLAMIGGLLMVWNSNRRKRKGIKV